MPSEPGSDVPPPDGFLAGLFEDVGIPHAEIGRIPPAMLRAFEEKLLAMTGEAPSAAALAGLMDMISQGGSPFGPPGPRPKKKR